MTIMKTTVQQQFESEKGRKKTFCLSLHFNRLLSNGESLSRTREGGRRGYGGSILFELSYRADIANLETKLAMNYFKGE
jgi:hypothetical protein